MKTSLGFVGITGVLAVATVVGISTAPVFASESDQLAAGEEISVYRRVISIEDGGKAVTFRAADGQSVVKADVAAATLMQGKKGAMKSFQAAELKEGMVCEISYSGSKASKLECDPEESE